MEYKIIKLKGREFPDPDAVRGIMICNAGVDYTPGNDLPELEPNRTEVGLLVGNHEELENLMSRRLAPSVVVDAPDAVRRISTLYALALASSSKGILIGCTQRIVFVTEQAAYVRGFGADYGEVLEVCMQSGAIWREFRKIGQLRYCEPDANAPSFGPPHPGQNPADNGNLVDRAVKVVTLRRHEFPQEVVRGILIYAESDGAPEHRFENRDMCLLLGNRAELEANLGGILTPRMASHDPNAVQTISRLYRETLAHLDPNKPGGYMGPTSFGAAWSIVFVGSDCVYVRGFGDDGSGVYDGQGMWSRELRCEFVKIGYLKEGKARGDSTAK